MARGPVLDSKKKCLLVNGIPASAYDPKELKKRFACMLRSVPPFENQNIKKKTKKKKKSKTKKASSSAANISSKEDVITNKFTQLQIDKFANEVSPPAIPLGLYECVKNAADIMNHPEWPNDENLVEDLEVLEYEIDLTCRFFGSDVPTGWKYKRENARSLIEGYHDKVIIRDGIKYMV